MVPSFSKEYAIKAFTTLRNFLLYVGNFDTLLTIPIILPMDSLSGENTKKMVIFQHENQKKKRVFRPQKQ